MHPSVKIADNLAAPALVMLCGLPCSGKSTWIEKFRAHNVNEWVVISSDAVIDELCAKAGVTYSEGFSRFIKQAGQEMNRRAKQAFKDGKCIIWDQTNLTVKARAGKLKEAKSRNYSLAAVVFNVDMPVLLERNEARNAATGKFIPKHVFDNMESCFVAPTSLEGFKKVVSVRNQ